MVRLARILGEGFYFVRIDFYSVGSKIYFGEMTFTPGSGTSHFEPAKWEIIWGNMIKLPNRDKADSLG